MAAISTRVKDLLNRMNRKAAISALGTVIQNIQNLSGMVFARGSVIAGNSSGVGAALDAKGDGKILVGDGTDVASVAVSGDISLTNAGVTAIGADKVGVAQLKSSEFSAAQIIVGDSGGDPAVVSVSGDVSLADDGAVTIAAGAVEESMLASNTADALNAKRIARATYDFSVDGGSVGAIGLGVTLPDNAIIQRAFIDVVTGMTSAGGAGTIALHAEGAGDILAAVDADTLSGIEEGIQDGTAANMVKCTAARELTATIAVEDLTAGAFVLFVEYVVSD